MLNQFWVNRTRQEKLLLTAASIVLLLILFFWSVLLPLKNKKDELLIENENQKELLVWMQAKAPLFLKMKNKMGVKVVARDLFSITEEIFKDQSKESTVNIARLSDEKVSLNLKKYAFDELMKKITYLWEMYGIGVDEISLSRSEEEGLIEGKVILIKSARNS